MSYYYSLGTLLIWSAGSFSQGVARNVFVVTPIYLPSKISKLVIYVSE